MLESVISLSEENFDNDESYSQTMTLEAKEDNKQEEIATSTTQHFTKNPNRTDRDTQHLKPKPSVTFENKDDSNDSEEENEHQSLSQQDSGRTYANFTLAKKEGRPIYAVRANYRYVLHNINTFYHS